MSNIQETKINPNFTVVTEYVPHFASAALGLFFAHGSRYETSKNNGITHLIQRTLFKGTAKKSTNEIAFQIEGAGAIVDGFSGKETSGIYCRSLINNLDEMIDLISEITFSPLFDEKSLEKEKSLIIQEIDESQDDPQEYVFSLLFQAVFPNHPLSYLETGTPASIKSISREQLNNYYHKKLLPSKVCLSVAGNINHDRIIDKIKNKGFQALAANPTVPESPVPNTERISIYKARKDLTQIHAAAATPTISYQDEQRYGLVILNTIWGGTMNSRLFHRIREQEALVYSIFLFIEFFSDTGLFGAYFVSDTTNNEKIFQCGYDETMKLKNNGVTKEEFEDALNYCKNQLVLGSENLPSRMIRNAKNNLLLDKVIPIEESIAHYDQLTLASVNGLTENLPLEYSGATIGPTDQSDFLKHSSGPQKIIIKD
jgi:predicted Zn-dependent peptidase